MNEERTATTALVSKVLTAWLGNWQPAPPTETENTRGVTLKTTEDIVLELSDMVDTDAGTVAQMMDAAGYRIIYRIDGRHGWAMSLRQE